MDSSKKYKLTQGPLKLETEAKSNLWTFCKLDFFFTKSKYSNTRHLQSTHIISHWHFSKGYQHESAKELFLVLVAMEQLNK